jgi:hypothetical protein
MHIVVGRVEIKGTQIVPECLGHQSVLHAVQDEAADFFEQDDRRLSGLFHQRSRLLNQFGVSPRRRANFD